jgi:hypothetical protein
MMLSIGKGRLELTKCGGLKIRTPALRGLLDWSPLEAFALLRGSILVEDLPGDDHALDFAGAFADGAEF